ncbi:unnamed protein product [Owenia fusiformis]|uniref:Cytochrome P450 n=1 Tax=Owenia fusiformis TaxID=6347 RepID=A0A8S4Q9X8_OWEFU|nr:unnamed protein product [Owenia fusiformis]
MEQEMESKHTSDGAEFYQLCDYVHREADCIINRRKKELLTGNPLKKKHLDFLDILLMAKDENGIGLTTKEIRAEVDTFMLAGHDTTGAAISWTMYALAKYPEYQEKVRNEVDAILEDTGGALEWEDLSKLQLLTLFMKETMRLYAPVPFISRCLDDDVVIDGKKVLAGVNVRLCIWAMHRHPDIWGEDVEEFKPERFHPDKMKDFDSFGYIPFSAGPRNCIGQNFALAEEKVLLARLLHKYELSLPDDTPEIIPSVRLVLKVEGDDIKLRLRIRK